MKKLALFGLCITVWQCATAPKNQLESPTLDSSNRSTENNSPISYRWNDLNLQAIAPPQIVFQRDSLFPKYIQVTQNEETSFLHLRPIPLGEIAQADAIAQKEHRIFENQLQSKKSSSFQEDHWQNTKGYSWSLSGTNKKQEEYHCGFVFPMETQYIVYHKQSLNKQELNCQAIQKTLSSLHPIKNTNTEQNKAFSQRSFTFPTIQAKLNNIPPLFSIQKPSSHTGISPVLQLSNQDNTAELIVLAHHVPLNTTRKENIRDAYFQSLNIDPNSPHLSWTKNTFEYTEKDVSVRGQFSFVKNQAQLTLIQATPELWVSNSKDFKKVLQSFSWLKNGEISKWNTAQLLNQIGMNKLARNQHFVALGFFEKANALDPRNPIYLINCGFIYQTKNMANPGTKHFESQIKTIEKHGKLLSILGELHEDLFNYASALQYYEKALNFDPYDEELVINQSDALWGVGYKNESLEVVQSLHDKAPSLRLGVYLSKTFMGLDRYAEAIDLLHSLQKKYGLTLSLGKALASALLFQERYEEALSVTSQILSLDPQNASLWLNLGKSQYYLKQFKQALHSFKKSKLFNPRNEEINSFLSATKAFLGKGDNKAIRKKIKALQKPVSLKTALSASAKKEAQQDNEPAIIHLQKENVFFRPHKPWIITEEWVVEILNEAGLSLFNEFSFPFIPGYDRLYINQLKVYNSSKKLKYTSKVSEYYVTSELKESLSAETQLLHTPIKKLMIGDIIHIQFSRTSISPKNYFPFVHHQASNSLPTALDIFEINADTSKLQLEEYGDTQVEAIPTGLRWTLHNPTQIRTENFMPHFRDIGSGVLVGNKRDWASVGQEYYNLIQHQFKQPVAVREKALELAGNTIERQTIINRIIDWVRHNIRYQESGFGGHSLIPQPSITTLNQRNGDCKDQSLLLLELLKTLNIPSELTLINLTDPVSEALPSIQQFNHMILHIPAGKDYKEQYVDLTEDIGTERIIPFHLEGRNALIVTPTQSKFLATPSVEKTKEHKVELFHTIGLSASDYTDFRDSLVLRGKFSAGLRDQLHHLNNTQQQEVFQKWFSYEDPSIELSSLRIDNLVEYSKPLVINLIYRSKQIFEHRTNIIRGQIPAFFEKAFMRLPKVTQRHHPLRLNNENHFFAQTKVLFPKTWNGTLPVSPSNSPRSYTKLEANQEEKPGKWTLTRKWSTFAVYADPSEYEEIQKEWNSILQTNSPILQWSN